MVRLGKSTRLVVMRQPNFVIVGTVASILLGLILLLDSYRQSTPSADATVSLLQLEPYRQDTSQEPDQSRLRFAVAPVISPKANLQNYSTLAAYLSEKLGRPVDLVQSKSYAETNALVRSGDVSLALVCSGAFVVGRHEFGMEALAVPQVGGRTTYRSYLITPVSSKVDRWEDLRNQTFAFTDPLSNSGRLVPVYVLSNMAETPEKFFKNFIFTYAHDKSIEAVAEGLVDGASVDSLVYERLIRQDPSIARKIRVAWKSPPYGMSPMVVGPSISSELRLQLQTTLLEMANDPIGRGILNQLGIDAFANPVPEAYDEIEAMLRATGTQ